MTQNMSGPSRRGPDKSGYLSEDTIMALATSVGGAVAIIRVSGPRAFELTRELTPEINEGDWIPWRLTRVALRTRQQGGLLDDALAVRFVGPRSFTGEDCVELHIHGGSYVAQRILAELGRSGIRQALPGEFSFRAIRNGKMSLSQAQAVSDLISSSNEGAMSLALEKMQGTQNRLVGEIAEGLRELATLGEVGIDFADQDVDEVSLPRLKDRLAPLSGKLERLQSSYERGLRLQDGVGAAFVGLPNAGKSSLFNALVGEDRSIVSDEAGTTRDVIRERLVLRGSQGEVTLRLEDTAGLRASVSRVENIGIERTRKAVRDADLIVLVVEASSDEAACQALREEWQVLGSPAKRAFGVITKRDLATSEQRNRVVALLSELGIATLKETSSVTGEGIGEAAAALADFCVHWTRREPGEVLLTRLDHQQAVVAALDHLRRAGMAPELDLFAADLRQALMALDPIIGETLPDDLLGRIFSQFCIGK